MSQVIDIYTLDSLQVNEIVFHASDSSPSIDDNHSTLSSSSQPRFSTLPPPRIGALLTNFKKFYVYPIKTIMRSFHVSPVHIVPVSYIHYRQNG